MTTIIDQKVISGIIAEEQQIQRNFQSAVATMEAELAKIIQMAAFLFTDVQHVESIVTPEYILDVTTRFNLQTSKLDAMMLDIHKIHGLGDSDPAIAEQNRLGLISEFNCNPASFTNRYK